MTDREVPQSHRARGIYIIRIGHSPHWVAAYVGSTTKSFHERWRRHIRKLEAHTHPNSDLQAFFDEDSTQLHFEILEPMRTRDKVRIETQERRWFEVLKPHITIINHQTPRVGKTSKRGRGLRRKRKARKAAAAARKTKAQASAVETLLNLEQDNGTNS